MEKYQACRDNALRQMNLADHILTMTYPLVQDPKLLKLVMKNVYLAIENTVSMLLHYERYYKRIPPFTENYESMVQAARPLFEKNRISPGYIGFLLEIKEVMSKQTESDVEFVRKDKFVFASKDYELDVITKKQIKDYIAKAKLFMHEIIGVVEENE
jgi:uncharacterized protein (UPF0332 family)